MKGIWFIILLLLLNGNCMLAQLQKGTDKKIILSGIVKDAVTLDPLAGSQIQINNAFSAISHTDGTFSVNVTRKDTLVFTLLGYQPAYFIVSDTLAGQEFIAGVFMKTDTLSIGEVVIVPRLQNLRYDIFKAPPVSQEMENARYNVAVSAYQGRMAISKLGDPISNYSVLHQKHLRDASEKGTIPSDRIVGLSPLLLIPGAYLLINGLPAKPAPMETNLSQQELELIHQKYLESLGKRKQ